MLNIQYHSMKSSQTDWGVGIIMPTFMTMTLELKEIQAPIPASLASQTQNKIIETQLCLTTIPVLKLNPMVNILSPTRRGPRSKWIQCSTWAQRLKLMLLYPGFQRAYHWPTHHTHRKRQNGANYKISLVESTCKSQLPRFQCLHPSVSAAVRKHWLNPAWRGKD